MTIDNEKEPTFIEITPLEGGKKASFKFAYHVLYTKDDDQSQFSFYIPGFDIYFFGDSIEESQELGRNMVKSFINFSIKTNGFVGLIQNINGLGFKTANHSTTMFNTVKLKKLNKREKFNSLRPSIPNGFKDAKSINEKSELSVDMF